MSGPVGDAYESKGNHEYLNYEGKWFNGNMHAVKFNLQMLALSLAPCQLCNYRNIFLVTMLNSCNHAIVIVSICQTIHTVVILLHCSLVGQGGISFFGWGRLHREFRRWQPGGSCREDVARWDRSDHQRSGTR
jgi:hypothetical protein